MRAGRQPDRAGQGRGDAAGSDSGTAARDPSLARRGQLPGNRRRQSAFGPTSFIRTAARRGCWPAAARRSGVPGDRPHGARGAVSCISKRGGAGEVSPLRALLRRRCDARSQRGRRADRQFVAAGVVPAENSRPSTAGWKWSRCWTSSQAARSCAARSWASARSDRRRQVARLFHLKGHDDLIRARRFGRAPRFDFLSGRRRRAAPSEWAVGRPAGCRPIFILPGCAARRFRTIWPRWISWCIPACGFGPCAAALIAGKP